MRSWSQALPPHIRLNRDGPLPKNVISLHLPFDQCIILATQPILLYTLIQSKDTGDDKGPAPSNAQTLKILGDACVHAARNTHSLIVDEWANGTLPIFGYFYAHYILSYHGGVHDHGNLAAKEFYDKLDCVRKCLNIIVDPADSLTDPAARGSDLSGLALPEITAPGSLTDMDFLGANMEEFLAQPDLDFGPLGPSGVPINVADAMYSWPTFSLWTA
ncbi:Transcription factor [Penicillium sp. IBT 16267x]|nr:Transcription factor [Penicillium sp. IBT 16267x]